MFYKLDSPASSGALRRPLFFALLMVLLSGSPVVAETFERANLEIRNVRIWSSSDNTLSEPIDFSIRNGVVGSPGDGSSVDVETIQIDATGHVLLGAIQADEKANIVIFEASPADDIAILATSAAYTKLVVRDGKLIRNKYMETGLKRTVEVDNVRQMPRRQVQLVYDNWDMTAAGLVALDYVQYDQDSASRQQVGDLTPFEGGDVADARLAVYGRLGGENSPVSYYVDLGFNGFQEGFDRTDDDDITLFNLELTTQIRRLGSLTVGRMKDYASNTRIMGGAWLPTTARSNPINALTRSRDNGLRLTNTAFNKRMTWALGLYNDWLSQSDTDFDEANTFATGRVTGLLLDDPDGEQLFHVGMSGRWTDAAEDTIRFRARPSIFSAPEFMDTGDIEFDDGQWFIGDVVWRKRNFMVMAEHVKTQIKSPTSGDLDFSGTSATFEWTLTGEGRGYNRDRGSVDRPIPNFDFGRGGKGLWAFALSWSDTDLTDGVVEGGEMEQIIAGISWYPSRSVRWGLEYSWIDLDRFGISGRTEFVHLFAHLGNL